MNIHQGLFDLNRSRDEPKGRLLHFLSTCSIQLNNFSGFQKWAAQKRSSAPTFWKPKHNGFLHSCAILIPQFVTVFPHFVAFFRTWTYFLLHFFPVLHLPIAQSHRVDPDVSVSFHAQAWKKSKLFIDEQTSILKLCTLYILDTHFQIKPFAKQMRKVIRPSTQYSCKSELLLTKSH